MSSAATTTTTVRADAKGRLTIPRRLREELGIEPGDTFFLDVDAAHGVLRFARAENPIDVLMERERGEEALRLLAEYAVREYEAGRTISLREYAAKHGITLDGE